MASILEKYPHCILKMSKMIQVVPHDSFWPRYFATESHHIQHALGLENATAVHHVGSTAVPGLSAKPSIDMIVVVKNAVCAIENLEKIGYQNKGEFNIPFRYFFSKRKPHDINLNLSHDFNLHLVQENHPEIGLNLIFRDHLRSHSDSRDLYAALKQNLLQDPASFQKPSGFMFSGYNLGKDAFIRKILEKEGYAGRRFLRVAHRQEWSDYHRIKKDLFDSGDLIAGAVYDPNHFSMTAAGHHHFILTCGVKTVAVAHIECLNQNEAALRALAVDRPYQGQGYGSDMVHCVEKWLKNQAFCTIKLHARPDSMPFYKKLGYCEMIFDDPSIQKNSIDLGKILE
jgi:GrpB-like predicted nucleotidyltransferase (UPF0157 family)/GNAT superfamily N-acetyltransferase